ncbi:MAG: HsdR family type I site-specific deoxyribonuclease [Flavipsychrobacter sp.]|nr:HsdR family type I site-specific deoxyribonuclease [Flavipsychrobacter sp.]
MRNERETQNRVVKLFQNKLGYAYLGNWEDRANNSHIEEEYLRQYLSSTSKYTDTVINKAIFDFRKAATISASDDIYPINKAVYSLLRYGVKVREEAGENKETVWLIDWEHPENNHFAIAEEVTLKGERTKRPDIVLYINGIAVGVLELKRGGISVTEGIRQNLDNQQSRFIKPFFATIQLVFAGNDAQGLYYGTTKTDEKYFLKWKEDNYTHNPDNNLLDQHLLQFCNKERILDVMHNFVVFDAGRKKLCRPNQYFGIKEAQKYLRRKEGGIIWHTQGSGKSLTMVWLAKWLRENLIDARLLIITDRTELDEQIEKVFKGVDEQIYRTKSGQDLLEKLNDTKPWLLSTLIHKFGTKDEADVKSFVEELKKPADFSPKGNLVVFIDECHRTQSGDLHESMKALLPEAVFIGFTGTPLLKADKKKSIEIFGRYIHTYKFDEAVADGVVLDLLYEARDVDQHVLDQKGIDQWFEAVTVGMNDLPKAELKQKWGTMQKVLSSKSRLEKIAFDIIKDFKMKSRLKDGRGNAILVSGSIYEACRYYEIFQTFNFKKCAIVTSFEPSAESTKGETTGDGETEKIEQYAIYQKMLNGKNREQFEKDVKKQFIDEPANMQLLIVVDKLLTGFDAPACTYLYIDKEMRDHGLFQAICRVNRTEKEDKEFGYIVDYKNLFNSLHRSIGDYTSDAFDEYDEEDVKGLLVDRVKKGRERLDDALETMHQLCEPVESPKGIEQYIKYFCKNTEDKEALKETEELRLTFYKSVVALIRAYNNIAPEMKEAGYTDVEASRIKQLVVEYTELRNSIKHASGDYVDLKKYEPEMRQLLDMYLTADTSRTISAFGDATLLQLIVESGIEAATGKLPDAIRSSKAAMAETLEANMRKAITQEMPINPVYYERMSVLLSELVNQRRLGAITYEEYLKKIEELAKDIQPKRSNNYPDSIDSQAKRALYDNLGSNEVLAAELFDKINIVRPDNWVGSAIKEKVVRNAIREILHNHGITDEAEVTRVFELATNQTEFK